MLWVNVDMLERALWGGTDFIENHRNQTLYQNIYFFAKRTHFFRCGPYMLSIKNIFVGSAYILFAMILCPADTCIFIYNVNVKIKRLCTIGLVVCLSFLVIRHLFF